MSLGHIDATRQTVGPYKFTRKPHLVVIYILLWCIERLQYRTGNLDGQNERSMVASSISIALLRSVTAFDG